MAGYKHGVYTREVPTSLMVPVETDAGLPVYFGTAPIHLATDPAAANRPVLCYNYGQAAAALGYSVDWENYTLCEAMYVHFMLYGFTPIVLVNVLDPAVHKTAKSDQEITFTNKVAKLTVPVWLPSLKVKKTSAGQPLTEGVDYIAAYNDDEELVITALEGGELEDAATAVCDFDQIDASAVDKDDIIGGVVTATGAKKGLEALSDVFPLLRLVPGNVLAPGWSDDPEVAAVMKAKAANINENFKAHVLTDVPTDTVRKYSDVPAWKENHNYTGENQMVCWPMCRLGDKIFHMSTQLMGDMMKTDSEKGGDIPYVSPSNQPLQIDGICLADGTEVILGLGEANYLNGQGIVTALNHIGGWRAWGDNTGCYPANTDPKDFFIPIRRMFNWEENNFIMTLWNKVDNPMNKRLVQTVVDTWNIRYNGLTALGAILGGRIEFVSDENPLTGLMGGKMVFHHYMSPPPPAKEIEGVFEYDPSYLNTLFS